MEYTGALGTIIFDESCHLCNLTEAQVGHNQFAMDMAVDRLDREVDHALERLSALEGKVTDTEAGYNELLALGREQVEMTTRSARALGQLATGVLAQQGKIRVMEERIDAMREMILALEHMQENPIMVDEEETCQGITPSNSKGGLPAPEARARAQRGNNCKPSKLNKQPERLT